MKRENLEELSLIELEERIEFGCCGGGGDGGDGGDGGEGPIDDPCGGDCPIP